jgi:capsular polysaccharide transport system permease protein
MNMHGFMTPADQEDHEITLGDRLRGAMWARRWLLAIVVLPTLIVAVYLYGFASDQYESEAHFLVHSADRPQVPTGAGAALSLLTGASSGQNEAMSVADYLTSHDAVAALRRDDHLVERFRQPGVDIFNRLYPADPTPERLLKYYQKHVTVKYNTETGITVVKVHSFTPKDSYEIARKLIEIGEQRVNMLNTRSYTDAISNARRSLDEAEAALTKNDVAMTAFRHRSGDIDPQASGQAQLGIVSGVQTDLAKARTQLAAMTGVISPSSPQYQALSGHIRALEAQLSTQSGKLTGRADSITNDVSEYQALMLRRDFLNKRYEVAAAGLEKAREQAIQQQLYLVRVVDANMPVKSTFPERGRILGTVLVALLLVYSIGWLLVAGVREHAA